MRLRFRKLAMRGGKEGREGVASSSVGCDFSLLRRRRRPRRTTIRRLSSSVPAMSFVRAALSRCVVISTEQFHLNKELSYLARKEVNYDNRF